MSAPDDELTGSRGPGDPDANGYPGHTPIGPVPVTEGF